MALSLRPTREQKGSLAEWLGAGLQNRLQQFDSARNLNRSKERGYSTTFLILFYIPPIPSQKCPHILPPSSVFACFGMMFEKKEALCNN